MVSSWDGSGALLVVVLDVLCEISVGTRSVCRKSYFAFFALADLVDDALTARLVVL